MEGEGEDAPCTAVGAGRTWNGSGAVLGAVIAVCDLPLPRRSCAPIANTEARRMMAIATAMRLELRPLSPEVPMGSPDDETLNEKLASVAELEARFRAIEAVPGASARILRRTKLDCPTARSTMSALAKDIDQSSGTSATTCR